jgi:hypothetical protein
VSGPHVVLVAAFIRTGRNAINELAGLMGIVNGSLIALHGFLIPDLFTDPTSEEEGGKGHDASSTDTDHDPTEAVIGHGIYFCIFFRRHQKNLYPKRIAAITAAAEHAPKENQRTLRAVSCRALYKYGRSSPDISNPQKRWVDGGNTVHPI